MLTRSQNMSRVRGHDTRPEVLLRHALWQAGQRYRLKSTLPGRPDLCFPAEKIAVFLDGCFWHGCPQHYSAPATRFEFWAEKLHRNVLHDLAVDEQLLEMNWKSVHVWQHELRDLPAVVRRVSAARKAARGDGSYELPVPPEFDIAEPAGDREDRPAKPVCWYQCRCGSDEVRVLSVSGPGSLRARGKGNPQAATLVCTRCGSEAEGLVFARQ